MLVFQPGFAAPFDWSTGVITGRAAEYFSLSGGGYSNDEGFPYTRQRYEHSPLGRVVEAGLPGLNFSAGRSHTAQTTYTNNNDETFFGTIASGTLPYD